MSKSRGERGNKTPSTNQNAPSASQNSIIPGKFTEYDWNDLVENESCEEFVSDIVNDIANIACGIIFDNIITDRVPPYVVFSAKQMLLDLLEWEFIESDSGEIIKGEDAWIEDDEPQACVTDSWAQGAVPVVASLNKIRSPLSDIQSCSDQKGESLNLMNNECECQDENRGVVPIELTNAEVDGKTLNDAESSVTFDLDGNESAKDFLPEEPKDKDNENIKEVGTKTVSPAPPKEKKPANRRSTYKTHKGSLPRFQPISSTPVTDDRPKPGASRDNIDKHGAPLHSAESLFKHQHGRPPGIKEVVYDSNGNVVSVQKINVAALPNHRVRTKCSISDPAQDPLNMPRRNKFTNKNNGRNKYNRNLSDKSTIQSHLYDSSDAVVSLRTPLPPPLVDTMDVVEGVVIKEGALSKHGPKKNSRVFVEEQTLKPVQSGRGRTIDVHEIINKTTPTLNSYTRSRPLPAILM